MTENSPNEEYTKINLKEILLRGAVMLFIFILLSLYLYLIQSAYDEAAKKNEVIKKLFLFSSTIFGAGLIWDVSKHIALLKIENLKKFIQSLKFSAIWGLLYLAMATLTYATTNVLAGWLTIFSLFFLFAALVFCALCINSITQAIDQAMEKT
ncbi:hypothetical protein GTP38_03575 [Duganella sp. FT94W]|uniref:DUF2975 domain-containing protein n=1 Tax=Duganella lactea TaxID=2692173 RepID=A0ABW9V3Q1_9BURK|nr:hypothetical protein [Duganella lactea]MYM33415.1 hypothetical protein [Duganella lactea]